MTASTGLDDEEGRRWGRAAGLGYGLTYSLVYGLSAWGYDAWVLAGSRAELAWAKLAVGVPVVALIGAATGALAGRRDGAGAWVGAWMASGALTGMVAGGAPFAGQTLAAWMAEPGLRWVNVYPMGAAGAARMAFVAIVTGCVGSAVGLVGHLLMERGRDGASATGGTRGGPWTALVVCAALAVLPARLGDELINKPLRSGQRAVDEAMAAGLVGGATGGDDLTSASYTLHAVGHGLEAQEEGTIDAALDDGLVMRCQISGDVVEGCRPISPEFEAWMKALIEAGLQGGQGTALEVQAEGLAVDDSTLSWLASQGQYMSQRYQIFRETQRGGWVVMAAGFETGYTLTCRFHGARPVVLERCSGNQETWR